MARHARYTGKHAPGTTIPTWGDLALFLSTVAMVAAYCALDWTTF